ncbi:nuclear transport factor 2 family protein [Pseudarthrobacter sp. NS4]|uniref:nuclear transport factor 2 family protein n=1 Tax=Pseudarthrobacter sp. NS4 TaxID=2973976 RepID=UPI0021637E77|nr:nuclear transport factor 2 family protein [Pseudarthrobacter sp. NS4]
MTTFPASGSATALPEIRHTIEECLARYTRAMDNQEPKTAATLLADAELHFKNNPPVQGRRDIAGFFASVFPNPSRTRHLISNLTIEPGTDCIEYRAIYQRWSVADPTAPVCEALGHYTGRFTPAAAGLIWSEHRVITD